MDINQQYYCDELNRHYSARWGQQVGKHIWGRGPALPQPCWVYEYAPTDKTFSRVYATCGMTPITESELLELFILSPCQTEGHVELLTAIAHYHQTGARLGLGDTVNFGRPWLDKSRCSFGLISLPYPFGPVLENARIAEKVVRVLWLLPITSEERAFKAAFGLRALEELFEKKGFNYLDPIRNPVVEASHSAI